MKVVATISKDGDVTMTVDGGGPSCRVSTAELRSRLLPADAVVEDEQQDERISVSW